MKIQSAIATLVLSSVFVSPVFAQTAASAPAMANSQQSKMTDCNKQAGDKKGDDRKAFMKTCLSNKPAAAAPMSQQDKMKACNTQAADKKGDDRKAFMKTCLSNKPAN
ncbi:phosphate starvation-inducible protein PsiF [Paraburkholderia ginsengiterrae]|uniref:Phosphate starvation-inducible protein PsiF n=1 Tax=Paraburkholderia ginsengiterrae TaxID=1462993 RepID=A0A1A9MZ72_9BURK|nr:PsiF family protein [Paraburkholderia ginsengiterrae]OAJ53376.1 phosphate starvation-inducible protein PsiF [Paraburkholderia ginsengiterrae]OAJ58843.1 phosphate starvation-inducible protein PsiF [Paraburkholderia ginsengiterrae]